VDHDGKNLANESLSFKIRSHVMKGNVTESMGPRKIKSPNTFKGMSKGKTRASRKFI
jgi:hypothetical protein